MTEMRVPLSVPRKIWEKEWWKCWRVCRDMLQHHVHSQSGIKLRSWIILCQQLTLCGPMKLQTVYEVWQTDKMLHDAGYLGRRLILAVCLIVSLCYFMGFWSLKRAKGLQIHTFNSTDVCCIHTATSRRSTLKLNTSITISNKDSSIELSRKKISF